MENTANRGRRGVPLIKTASRLGRRRRIICEGNQGKEEAKTTFWKGKGKRRIFRLASSSSSRFFAPDLPRAKKDPRSWKEGKKWQSHPRRKKKKNRGISSVFPRSPDSLRFAGEKNKINLGGRTEGPRPLLTAVEKKICRTSTGSVTVTAVPSSSSSLVQFDE